MKNIMKSKKELILIIIGLIATIFSYIYYFSFNNPNKVILLIICVIDLVLFFFSAYTISLCFDKSKILTIIFSIIIMIIFLLFFEFVVLLAAVDSEKLIFTFDLFYKVLLIALFASPSLIILLPVIYFVAEVLS